MASNKLDEERFKANKEKYDQIISKANSFRDTERWEKSKELYVQANKLFPSETLSSRTNHIRKSKNDGISSWRNCKAV